jgi:Flagellar transcriptional activator (FlhC)
VLIKENVMRVIDDRYERDRLRFDLALRMMRLNAPGRMIREWTGLSQDRLRKLWRTYMLRRVMRLAYPLRFRLPELAGCFLKSSAANFEASTLGSLFCLLGLISMDDPSDASLVAAKTLERAATFCEAYETYLTIHPSARLSFEQAWLLMIALATRSGVKLNACSPCGRLYLTDSARLQPASCGCGVQRVGLPRRRKIASGPSP